MRKIEIMKPIVDFVFKQIFGGKKKESNTILMDFLNSVLNFDDENKITEIVYLNPYNDKEYKEDKLSIMDVKVKTQRNELIDIEVQINDRDNYRKRTLYYWSKMYGETIENGEAYDTLKKCIVVNLLDFNLLNETEKYHSTFSVIDIEEKFKLIEDLEIHYIELPKFNDLKNINEMTKLEEWITFIKDAGNKDKEDLIQKIRRKSEVIDMAGKILEKLSANEKIRQKYLAREKALLDEKSAIKYQQIKLEKALEEGRREGRIEIVRNLLLVGVEIEKIIEASQLSKEEIEKIKNEMN